MQVVCSLSAFSGRARVKAARGGNLTTSEKPYILRNIILIPMRQRHEILIVCTDFDGTIFDHDCCLESAIARSLLRWLHQAQSRGTRWIISSGRESPRPIVEQLALRSAPYPDFIVTGERHIWQRDSGDRFISNVAWNQRCHNDHEVFYENSQTLFEDIRDWISSRQLGTCPPDELSPFNILARGDSDADQIQAFLDETCELNPDLGIARNGNYFRFAHRSYSKGSVLFEISRQLEIGPEHVFAAGDHFNDLTMLHTSCAKMVAAPSNAVAAVKDAVNRFGGYVASRRCGDGVLQALRFFENGDFGAKEPA